MKTSLVATVTLLVLLVPSVQAQKTQDATQWGLGVSLIGGGVAASSVVSEATDLFVPVGIYVPIYTAQLRVEPEIGLQRIKVTSGETVTYTVWQLGIGIFQPQLPASGVRIYWGGRVGLSLVSSSVERGGLRSSASGTGLIAGPATGGEYFFSPQFSLGGELQLMYVRISMEGETLTSLRTRPLFFVRWYF
ncbi:outer membrane beta-barrel protein [Rhodothermus profundi]|nr:outer membrane beta-barrel protein [Rhodothermus profundi]